MKMQFEARTHTIILDGARTKYHAETRNGKTLVWTDSGDYIDMPETRYDLDGGKFSKLPGHERFKADFLKRMADIET